MARIPSEPALFFRLIFIPLTLNPKSFIVVYVIKHIINYASAIGWLDNPEEFNHWWPFVHHMVGKDIIRFHCVIWHLMLLALGLNLPVSVIAHGWWTREGEKMSKSRGNAVMLSATEDETAAVIKKATTDSERHISYEPERRPAVANLLMLISLCTGEAPEAIAERIGDGGGGMIDEYVVQYEEYPAIGSGGITYLGSSLYVNTFSLREYSEAIEAGRMSLMGRTDFNLHDRMRYRFLMQLFGLRLDKLQWERDFGLTVENGLPVEMAFMKAAGAFATDTPEELTLTPKGRYLVVAMMRQFFIGVNNLRDQARAALPGEERELLFG